MGDTILDILAFLFFLFIVTVAAGYVLIQTAIVIVFLIGWIHEKWKGE